MAGVLGKLQAAVDAADDNDSSLCRDAVIKSGIEAGRKQLAQQAEVMLSEAQEHEECAAFHAWAGTHEQVKCVRALMPCAALSGYQVEMLDYAPKSRMGDDYVYSNDDEVWRRLPRGCAIIVFTELASDNVTMRWAVRANRKFTGHEDEGRASAQLYFLNREAEEGEATDDALAGGHCILSIKENGSVLHLSARHVTLSQKEHATVVCVGSKKVHAMYVWDHVGAGGETNGTETEDEHRRDRVRQATKCVVENNPARNTLVGEMTNAVLPLLASPVVHFLAKHRLVANAEFLVPSGTGPVDNQRLHGLTQPRPVFFSMVVNAEQVAPGLELCLSPLFAFHLFRKWGWSEVGFVVCGRGPSLVAGKHCISGLAHAEGAVVYHLDRQRIVRQLEKVKASGYVLARALREKAKAFLNGRRGMQAAHTRTLENCQFQIAVDQSPSSSVTTLRVPGYDANTDSHILSDLLRQRGAKLRKVGQGECVWEIPFVPDAELVSAYLKDVQEKVHSGNVARWEERIVRRVWEVDHVPVDVPARVHWCDVGVQLLRYLQARVLATKAVGEEDVTKWFDNYSTNLTLFLEQDYTKNPKAGELYGTQPPPPSKEELAQSGGKGRGKPRRK